MAPDPNRAAAGGASSSGAAKDDAVAKKKVENEDLVSLKAWAQIFVRFVAQILGFKISRKLYGEKNWFFILGKFVQSDEDLALKQQLELYVERVQDPDPALQKVALESMR